MPSATPPSAREDVSIVMPFHGRLDLTRGFVESLRASWHPALREVVCVDDGSTDGSAAWLAGLGPPFRVVTPGGNRGFAAASNAGARAAAGALLLFCNNDLVVSGDWIQPMLDLAREPGAGAVGNVQLDALTGRVDHAGIAFDTAGVPFHVWKTRTAPPPGPWRERRAATAACLLVPRTLFLGLGGFSEDYRNGLEDIDLCVRLVTGGRRVLVAHDSRVRHWVSQSPGRHTHNAANRDLFLKRWAHVTRPWGREEWAGEYFHRYAERWWRMTPGRFARASAWLLRDRLAGRSVHGRNGHANGNGTTPH